ncbi:MAG: CBS domain-containing protein [Muribaculaceae bacterium]|nr:CBS domain-containing protein [Muribaculaceae bacterium]
MTVKDVLSPLKGFETTALAVEAEMPVFQALPRLLDAPGRVLPVVSEEGGVMGYVTESSMLEGLGRIFGADEETSEIVVECHRIDYSASSVARAVEDSDSHLLGIVSTPTGENDRIQLTLRVGTSEPMSAVRSLERYGYEVVSWHGAASSVLTATIAAERLLSLQTLLNV